MSNAIRQEASFSAPPAKIYQALTDQAAFAAFTGAPAEIEARAGGAFSLFGGRITGRNIELLQGTRVVQAWRPGNWPEGVYSMVTFALAPDGAGTRISFTQVGHPDDAHDHLMSGWGQMYWTPLRTYAG